MNEDQNDVFGSAPQTPPPTPAPLDSPVPPMSNTQDTAFPTTPLDQPVPPTSAPQFAAFPATPLDSPVPPMQVSQPITATNQPAKGLAIAGIVLAFFPLQLIGLILSIIAKKKATKPSSANTMSTIGIILNSVFLLFFTAGIIFIFAIIGLASTQMKANEAEAKTSAEGVTKLVTDYVDANRVLPTTTSDLNLATGTRLVSLTGQPNKPSDVEYAICNDGSVIRFGYWGYKSQTPVYSYGAPKGTAVPTSADNCLAVTQ